MTWVVRMGVVFVLATAAYADQSVLKLIFTPGAKAGYRVAMEQVTLSGDGKTVNERVANETPIQIGVRTARGKGGSLEITSGPLVVRGRPVGRSRTTTSEVDAGGIRQGRSPANFFVCLPAEGVKVNQTWRTSFFGGAPLPAGIEATYKYKGPSRDGRFGVVEMRVDHAGPGKVEGSGKLFVRRADGFLDHGNAKFTISYLRPDPKDRQKITVNSQVILKYTISKL